MPRYAAASRLDRLRARLHDGRATLPDLMRDLDVSESTVRRLLAALESAGAPLVEETLENQQKVWSLSRSSADIPSHTVRLTTAQLIALLIARNTARVMLRGTGLDDDLDAACDALIRTLRGSDAVLAKDLDRKLYDRGEMAVDHSAHGETLNEYVSALLREERVELRRVASDGEERTHLFDPYSLATYKKGLYFVGYSHDRAQVIAIGIDAILDATRQRGNTFPYPADYRPEAMYGDSMGMFVGSITDVALRFADKVKRFVVRRPIHRSQRVLVETAGGPIEVALRIAGTTELESLVLSYGDHVEVLSPPTLRKKIGDTLRRAAALYADG